MEEEKIYCVYIHISPSNKSYVGQSNNYNKRCWQHQYKNGCPAFYNAIKKYGWDNFNHEIILENLTINDANLYEKCYIFINNSFGSDGYNLTTGGENHKRSEETCKKLSEALSGRVFTEESRKKMSESAKVRIFSDDTRRKISEANSGEGNANFGKHWSDEWKTQQSIRMLGKKHTAEQNEAKRVRMLGKNSGEDNAMFGKFGKDNPTSKKYIVTHPDGHNEFVIGIAEFSRKYNIIRSHMCAIANGKRTHHKGFKCRYATQEEIEQWTFA